MAPAEKYAVGPFSALLGRCGANPKLPLAPLAGGLRILVRAEVCPVDTLSGTGILFYQICQKDGILAHTVVVVLFESIFKSKGVTGSA